MARWAASAPARVGARHDEYERSRERVRERHPNEIAAIEAAVAEDERALRGEAAPSFESAVRILKFLIRQKGPVYLDAPQASLLAAVKYIVFWGQLEGRDDFAVIDYDSFNECIVEVYDGWGDVLSPSAVPKLRKIQPRSNRILWGTLREDLPPSQTDVQKARKAEREWNRAHLGEVFIRQQFVQEHTSRRKRASVYMSITIKTLLPAYELKTEDGRHVQDENVVLRDPQNDMMTAMAELTLDKDEEEHQRTVNHNKASIIRAVRFIFWSRRAANITPEQAATCPPANPTFENMGMVNPQYLKDTVEELVEKVGRFSKEEGTAEEQEERAILDAQLDSTPASDEAMTGFITGYGPDDAEDVAMEGL